MKTYWELTGQQQTIDAEKLQEKRMEQKCNKTTSCIYSREL
jgi:hypothetical protein